MQSTSYEKEYWNARYRGKPSVEGNNSGYGSYGDQLEQKINWLRPLKDIKTITEIGCGDFNFGSRVVSLYEDVKYSGYDISDEIIDRNRRAWPQYHFGTMEEAMTPADLVMCVDVLFHVIDSEEAKNMVNLIESLWTKYLVVTAYERDEFKENHVRIRKFNYERFGTPKLREIIEEDGQMYFYIFER